MPDASVVGVLPPGPSSRLLSTIRFAREPYKTFEECRARYGDPFTLPILGSKAVVTGRPELVQSIYALPHKRVGGLLGHLIPEILGPTSLLVLSGEKHTTDRKLMMPMFHGERMAVYARTIARVTREKAAGRAGHGFERMYELGRSISLEVILRALFGVEEDSKVESLRRAVLDLSEAGPPALIFFRALRRSFLGFGPWTNVEKKLAALDALLYAQIAERRAAPGGEDILAMLLAARYEDGGTLTDLQIRDQLMSLILAGHETMAVTLAWGMHWVLVDADVRARLEEEIAPEGDPSRLPYLDAVCNEILRIWPIQPIVFRYLLEPCDFGGFRMDKGTFVGAATTLVHMNPSIYPEPHRFKPERFLGWKPGPGEFFPFGGGARKCLGAAFALYEMKVVIATLLREFRLSLASTETPRAVRQSTVTGPAGGVPLAIEARA